ncbi:MAG: hypothetical protein NT030_07350 [Candidatus Saganbacteria bacterium]|nr:hypothetical protein [Candidatus Saganbacteria bacterium]
MSKYTGNSHPLCKTCIMIQRNGNYRDDEKHLFPEAGIVKLGNHWFANCYNGNEGFFGWMCISPQQHYNNVAEICNQEVLKDLGVQFQRLSDSINKYWHSNENPYKDDKIKKIYLVLLAESIDDENDLESEKEIDFKKFDKWHLHFHVIPRYESLKDFGGWDIFKNKYKYKLKHQACKYDERLAVETVPDIEAKKLINFLKVKLER